MVYFSFFSSTDRVCNWRLPVLTYRRAPGWEKKIGVGKFATTPSKILTELAGTDYWFVTNAVFHVTQLYYNTQTDHDAIRYCNHKSNSAMYLEYSGFNPRYKIFFTWAYYCTMHSLRQVFTLLNHLLYFIYALVIARQ